MQQIILSTTVIADEVSIEKSERAHALIVKQAVSKNIRKDKEALRENRFKKAAKRNIKPSNRAGNRAQQKSAWLFEADED